MNGLSILIGSAIIAAFWGGFMVGQMVKRQDLAADSLQFDAQRLRNVMALAGVSNPFPDSDRDLIACMGAILGQVAGKLRARNAQN